MRETSSEIQAMADEVVACSGGSVGTIYAALRDAYQMGRYSLTYDHLKLLQQKELADWKEAMGTDAVLF